MGDYVENVKRFTSSVNEAAVKGVENYLGKGVLAQRDASLVSCTDPDELGRIRDGFAKKKLDLSEGGATDAAIQAVCEKMSEERNKCRVTFYYLLAEQTGTLGKLA